MAGIRLPGIVCRTLRSIDIDLGTLCQTASPAPGISPTLLPIATKVGLGSAHVLAGAEGYIDNAYVDASDNTECVTFAQQVGGAPPTSEWVQGASISPEHPPEAGTWVATFVNRKFDGHVGVFVEFTAARSLKLIDQFDINDKYPADSPWHGGKVLLREYRARAPGYGGRRSNDPTKYSVVMW